MKAYTLLSILALGGGLFALAQYTLAPTPEQPAAAKSTKVKKGSKKKVASKKKNSTSKTAKLTTSKDWLDPTALRDKLATKIQAKLSSPNEGAIKKFLKSDDNRLLLASWHLAHAEVASEKARQDFQKNLEKKIQDKNKELNTKKEELPLLGGTAVESTQYSIEKLELEIAELEAELKQPMNLADVAGLPHGAKLIELLVNDLDWMEDFVYSGECLMPGRALNMLSSMMKNNPDMLTGEQVARDVATATALEFARFGWTVDNACKRAEYFVKNWQQDKLHKIFDTLPFWQRRVVCGWKGDHSSGTPESFTWALNNVNLPDDRYSGSCWRCGYVLHNVYGEIVHGRAYYTAYEGMYTGRHHEFTQEVGGVCGGLSHFGASAACANGIPALTMGEPAHCAFVVWVDGKWTPAYSVSWERGLHWRPWLDNWRYSSLHMLTEQHSSAQKDDLQIANTYRALAHMATTASNTTAAIDYFLKAEAAQPRHYQVFREHADMLAATKAGAEAWLQLNDSLCTNMVPVFAECASELMRSQVYDQLSKNGTDASKLEAAFAKFWKSTRELGPERWKVQDLLNKQIDLMNNVRKGSELENQCTLYRHMLKGTINNPAYATYSLESGNTLMQKMDDAAKARMLGIMTDAIGNGNGLEGEARTKVLTNIILAAEANRDASAFQSVSKLIAPEASHDNRPIGDFEGLPGKLVSEGGVLIASSTSQWDRPATHANVLTKKGGQVHTAKNKDPWIGVKLPKYATISGIVIAAHANSANWHRLNGLQVQVSETGRDDDWHNVGQPTGKYTQRITRISLGSEQPKALYVRIIRPGVQEVLHIDGLFVYGTPAA